jgi:glycosyltransferase involved in cell wall biosynthesis
MSRAAPIDVVSTSAAGPDAPAFRIRSLLLRDELARHGVRLQPLPLVSGNDDLPGLGPGRRLGRVLRARRDLRARLASSDAPVALAHRQVDFAPDLTLERAALQGRVLVYDLDDPIWLSWTRSARGHPLAALKGSGRKARWLAERAAHVIAGNEILAEWLGRHSDHITVVPSTVETREVAVRQHEDRDTLVIGWIGSQTTAGYLAPLLARLGGVSGLLPGRRVKLLMVGGTAVAPGEVEVESLPWSVESERRALAEMDIGVMPLPDNPWTRGKCAYKAIQYMAAGVPVVADDVGISRSVVGTGGLIPAGDRGWADALVQLGNDAALRARIGADGRTRAEDEFSVERWAPAVAGILRRASR